MLMLVDDKIRQYKFDRNIWQEILVYLAAKLNSYSDSVDQALQIVYPKYDGQNYSKFFLDRPVRGFAGYYKFLQGLSADIKKIVQTKKEK